MLPAGVTGKVAAIRLTQRKLLNVKHQRAAGINRQRQRQQRQQRQRGQQREGGRQRKSGQQKELAHNILVESAISHAAGVSFVYASVLRIGIAFLAGFILYRIYFYFGFLQEKFSLVLEQRVVPTDYYSWVLGQVENLIYIFFIICILVFSLNILKKIGVEQFIKKILENPLKLMGIGSGAINIIIVGLTIGLQFGGGLLIKEAKSGTVDKQSILLSLSLLNLIHAIIEDTILMMIIGGHISGVLFFRIIFCLIIVFLILYLYKKFSGLFKFVFV